MGRPPRQTTTQQIFRCDLHRGCGRRAFSLIELVVVMAVTLLLTGLLLPTLTKVRENARRVVCASNQRQLGMATFMYAGDHDDDLPVSAVLDESDAPQELMIAHTGGAIHEWDGIGQLYMWHYCDAPGCYYCPSHVGHHTYERYAAAWQSKKLDRIYTNYHYAGHKDWQTNKPRSLDRDASVVLLTDGLRTKLDFNHRDGFNALKGDGSVSWQFDDRDIYDQLPDGLIANESDAQAYKGIWGLIESP